MAPSPFFAALPNSARPTRTRRHPAGTSRSPVQRDSRRAHPAALPRDLSRRATRAHRVRDRDRRHHQPNGARPPVPGRATSLLPTTRPPSRGRPPLPLTATLRAASRAMHAEATDTGRSAAGLFPRLERCHHGNAEAISRQAPSERPVATSHNLLPPPPASGIPCSQPPSRRPASFLLRPELSSHLFVPTSSQGPRPPSLVAKLTPAPVTPSMKTLGANCTSKKFT